MKIKIEEVKAIDYGGDYEFVKWEGGLIKREEGPYHSSMKLRNKITGTCYTNVKITPINDDTMSCWKVEFNGSTRFYDHFDQIRNDWEEYEEPKEYRYIEPNGVIARIDEWDCCTENDREVMRLIGNYFETKEEAEKAVEKLKAWKRLKDKGFRFTGIAGISNNIYVSFETDSKYRGGHVMYDKYSNTDNNLREYNEDLMLLFGGED